MSVVLHSANASAVVFSENATQHVIAYLKKNNSQGVRLSVKKTGCSGLSYIVDYVKDAVASDITFPLKEDYFIYVDKASWPYLQGLQIDYVKQGLNYKFVFNNPNQTGQCGCGESFTVE